MAEIRLSTGALNEIITGYLKLLEEAKKIEVDTGKGSRVPLDDDTRDKILESLSSASSALLEGCQQTVYGLFLTQQD